MTRKEMVDQIQGWLGLQDIAVLDETAMIDPQLYQGTIDLLARTKCVARPLNLQTLANVDTYLLPHDVLAIIDFQDSRPRARRDDTDLSPAYTLIRSDLLRVSPVPDVDGEIQIWAVKRPAQMTADTDSPGDETFGAIPDEYQDAIVTYALWKLADYADDGGSGQGQTYRVLYEGQDGRGGRIRQILSQVNRRAPSLPARKVSVSAVPSPDRRDWVG
jgi:hypothetical protein